MRGAIAVEIAVPYSSLAANYDAAMGIPFFLRTRDFFERLVRRYGVRFRSAADVGCGTGLFARHLNDSRGIPVFAVDLSAPMLRVAARNCRGTEVVLLNQDLRSLRLPRPVDLVTANFDTLNHLLRHDELRLAVRRVFENLNPGGHFIFDVVTNCLGIGPSLRYVRRFGRRRAQVTQAVRLDPLSNLLSIEVSIRSPATMRPIIERHVERVLTPKEIGEALFSAGFSIRGIHDASTLEPARECAPRIVVVARKS
jgi:SAM-dependent methyltransferase